MIMSEEEYDLIALIQKRRRDVKSIQQPVRPRQADTGIKFIEEGGGPDNAPVVENGGPALSRESRTGSFQTSRGSTEKEWGGRPPFVPNPRTPADYPKTWETTPQIGDSVFYNGERYWVANAMSDWTYTSF